MISFHKRIKNISSICLKNKVNYKVPLHSSKQLEMAFNTHLQHWPLYHEDLENRLKVIEAGD